MWLKKRTRNSKCEKTPQQLKQCVTLVAKLAYFR